MTQASMNNDTMVAVTPEPWPGCYADLQQRRVMTLAKLGLMLSVMAGGEAAEVVGYDAADLYAEVLMALAIEDADDTDIALEEARDHPDSDILARHQSGRTGAGEAGWIVGNSGGTKWRCWGSVGPDWTDDRDKATRYARRIDAERVHAEDDDAWRVVPYAAVEIGS